MCVSEERQRILVTRLEERDAGNGEDDVQLQLRLAGDL